MASPLQRALRRKSDRGKDGDEPKHVLRSLTVLAIVIGAAAATVSLMARPGPTEPAPDFAVDQSAPGSAASAATRPLPTVRAKLDDAQPLRVVQPSSAETASADGPLQTLPNNSDRFSATPARQPALTISASQASTSGHAWVDPAQTGAVGEPWLAALGADHFVIAPDSLTAKRADPAPAGATVDRTGPDTLDGFNARSTARAVNLRAGPSKRSKVLDVVPANATILAEADCQHWCSVVYEGRNGYIYKSFIRWNGKP